MAEPTDTTTDYPSQPDGCRVGSLDEAIDRLRDDWNTSYATGSGHHPRQDAHAVIDKVFKIRKARTELVSQIRSLREEVALLTEYFQALCGEIGHDWCKCVIPCHMGCIRCDAPEANEVRP